MVIFKYQHGDIYNWNDLCNRQGCLYHPAQWKGWQSRQQNSNFTSSIFFMDHNSFRDWCMVFYGPMALWRSFCHFTIYRKWLSFMECFACPWRVSNWYSILASHLRLFFFLAPLILEAQILFFYHPMYIESSLYCKILFQPITLDVHFLAKMKFSSGGLSHSGACSSSGCTLCYYGGTHPFIDNDLICGHHNKWGCKMFSMSLRELCRKCWEALP